MLCDDFSHSLTPGKAIGAALCILFMPINIQRGTDLIKRNKLGILDLVVIKKAAAYQDATALDALIGYLYFSDRTRHEDFTSELDVSMFT
jgi:hypothetical protein